MLDLAQIDLSALASALEDHNEDTTWYLDPRTGELESWSEFLSEHDEDEEDRLEEMIRIEPLASGLGYQDMEDFIERVLDPRARDLLRRAIEGRGAFRRFKDTLFEFPDLRTAWFAFHDARAERRALEWLAAEEILDRSVTEREIAARPDPDVPVGIDVSHPISVAGAVARDLRDLYGERLRGVLLFGSWARGDAHPESDIDLLVILDHMDSAWDELDRMEPISWRHSSENDVVVSISPVSEADLRAARTPFLRRVIAEGREVA